MTKAQLLELGLNETQIAAVLKLAHSYNDTRAHAPIYEGDTIVAKWCSRHHRYEPIEVFPKNSRAKDGYYSHCRYAERHLKKVSREIEKLKASVFDEDVDVSQVKKQVDYLESIKHVFDDDGFTKSQLKQIEQLNK
jgi:hypothetical protein